MPEHRPASEVIPIDVENAGRVTGLWLKSRTELSAFVLSPGAGSNVHSPFLESLAQGLLEHGVSSLRYQFPFMERGSKRPDPPAICHRSVRAAVAAAVRCTSSPLLAGGRSFGGRMTSQAQAVELLTHVRGLIFLSFPLHPAKRPSVQRAEHLGAVSVPMLFLQGTRDDLAEGALMQSVVSQLGARATLRHLEGADHGYKVLARSGRSDDQVLAQIVTDVAWWAAQWRFAAP